MQDKVTPPDPGVDDLVTGLLTASRVLVGVAARSLHEVEDIVTVAQFRTLVVLSGHGEMKLSRLAELCAVNASTAQRMVERLSTAGLVARRTNPDNRREVLLTLTDEGRRVVDTVTEQRRHQIARIVRRMPTSSRSAVVAALRDFASAADEPEPEVDGSLWGFSLLSDQGQEPAPRRK
ncbi:MarR family transcriptional regulator [Nocardioides koreensis]|uniref:MarR family transcriptional regulator n=1 Tax=Nocardioides koreensis TaxID=433651 RepID=A0ABP5LLZ2_9ACTN